ncbi:MAG: 5-methyltetrahydropteroyltriglutamate--homocysteine S-methyltransferase [Coxiellaceae bacterium]|nr:5-methyltetrahydropteroyltriglutamate--homocysteine S-methyltransferase [Coxiellaceae bacterium]
MTTTHILGFPRIGSHREIKKAQEAYWKSGISYTELQEIGSEIKRKHWQWQQDAGLGFVSVGDFSWYDHVLDTAALFGIIPERFKQQQLNYDINTYFCMARGKAPNGLDAPACEMTKWFDTNYHYIVPELTEDTRFEIIDRKLFSEVRQAIELGYKPKPTLLGPISLLWLSKAKDDVEKLNLLSRLKCVYQQVLLILHELGVEWVQLDEPAFVLDLPKEWQQAAIDCYQDLNINGTKCLLATYFGPLKDNLDWVTKLPVAGLHIDACRGADELEKIVNVLPQNKILSVGAIDGRNIWRADLNALINQLIPIKQKFGERLWIGPSCSLLHCPIDLELENHLDKEIKSWLAFAKQKLNELVLLAKGLGEGKPAIADQLAINQAAVDSRHQSSRIHNPSITEKLAQITSRFYHRTQPYQQRADKQREKLKLPLLPTTTIGSFPQTNEIRLLRRDYKKGELSQKQYDERIKQHIAADIKEQESLGLDVLVHGEAERNDMVEHFAEHLDGFAFTQYGWVQSYGSRCVKPPVIYGDVSRKHAMTVAWSQYAQSLTGKPVKAMLTGPVTILAWSFVRDDQPESDTARQIALALRDEVTDLEAASLQVIQIDEPAFRELLPLRQADWQAYLSWATACFRLSSSGVKDETQIHTHMCYSEFNDIISSIADLDADVITLESSRSDMELLKAFDTFAYPNEIGPGVYDIHSPRVPATEEICQLLDKAEQYVPTERLWVNPDCGLKTRAWPEVKAALTNLVSAAKQLRAKRDNLAAA